MLRSKQTSRTTEQQTTAPSTQHSRTTEQQNTPLPAPSSQKSRPQTTAPDLRPTNINMRTTKYTILIF
ncbi:MAG: hypothetical protein ACQESC_01550 [Nanobdellota archaeon]